MAQGGCGAEGRWRYKMQQAEYFTALYRLVSSCWAANEQKGEGVAT